MQLVSRLQHLLDSPAEIADFSSFTIAKIRFTIWWFSNVGPLLSSLVDQKLSDNTMSKVLNPTNNSFYDMILGQYDKASQNLDVPDEAFFIRLKTRSYAEKNFWAGCEEGINQQYKYYSELFIKEEALKNLDSIVIYK